MTTDNAPKPRFSDWLKDHRNGLLDVELAEAFEELVRAVGRTEKPGSITLKIKVTSESDMVAVNDDVVARIPEKREARLYFVDLDGQLTRNNPLQPSLLDQPQPEQLARDRATPNRRSTMPDFEGLSNAAAIIESTEELALAAANLEELHNEDQVYEHIFAQTRRKADGSWELATLDAEQWAKTPRRKRGHVKVTSTESLAEYVNTHATVGTTLYANADGVTVEAILDDHATEGPRHRSHRATLTLVRTPGCLRWLNAHASYLGQEEFAQLIEDGLAEIARPDGATLLEVAQSIRATKSAAFRSDKRLATGRVQFQWVEDLSASAGADGDLEIPEMVTLVFEPFYGADKVQVDARFRYRIRDGKLLMGFWLVRHEEALRDAFAAELNRLNGLLNVGVLMLDGASS